MAKTTKAKILGTAAEIFARDGYSGTNIKDIADSLGIVKSALYKHFDSKEALWNAVLDDAEAYYAERFGSASHLPPVPESCDAFRDLCLRMVDFTMHDKKIILMRKILLTEQFRNERARQLADSHFSEGLERLFEIIFTGMTENGSLKKESDPAMLAFAFAAPVSALIQLCDREPEREPEISAKIRAFLDFFIKEHGIEKE